MLSCVKQRHFIKAFARHNDDDRPAIINIISFSKSHHLIVLLYSYTHTSKIEHLIEKFVISDYNYVTVDRQVFTT